MQNVQGLPVLFSLQSANTKLTSKILAQPLYTNNRDSSKETQAQFAALPVRTMAVPDITMPVNFNGKEVWGKLLTPIVNQGSCGSCWAWGSTTVLADRYNIFSRGANIVELSATKMLLCDLGGREYDIQPNVELKTTIEELEKQTAKVLVCHGNSLADAWRYLFTSGVPTDQCFPYTLTSHLEGPSLADITEDVLDMPICSRFAGKYRDQCVDGTPQRSYRCVQYYTIPGIPADKGSEKNIQHEIYANGPISTAFRVYPDFYQFDPAVAVYRWNGKGPQVGGHAVRVIGWGENKVDGKFWWIANSFGVKWGIDGYFKMARGDNMCGLEENVIVGLPDLFLGEEASLRVFGLDPKVDFIAADVKFRQLAQNISTLGGGIDPLTGYNRYYYKLWPALETLHPKLTFSEPFVAANVTWKIVGSQLQSNRLQGYNIDINCPNNECVSIKIIRRTVLIVDVLLLLLIMWVLIWATR